MEKINSIWLLTVKRIAYIVLITKRNLPLKNNKNLVTKIRKTKNMRANFKCYITDSNKENWTVEGTIIGSYVEGGVPMELLLETSIHLLEFTNDRTGQILHYEGLAYLHDRFNSHNENMIKAYAEMALNEVMNPGPTPEDLQWAEEDPYNEIAKENFMAAWNRSH